MNWRPTHVLELSDGTAVAVMLADGAAYTMEEWTAECAADYECNPEGWTFQGRAFNGAVHAIAPAAALAMEGMADAYNSLAVADAALRYELERERERYADLRHQWAAFILETRARVLAMEGVDVEGMAFGKGLE